MNLLSEQKRTIIIVDDDKSILKVFTRVFEKKGYQVTTAENGKDSLDKLGHFRYNVALIDVRLPDMMGTDILSMIQATSPETIKIVFTGSPYLDGVTEMNQYMDAFFIKPIKPELIIDILEEKLKTK